MGKRTYRSVNVEAVGAIGLLAQLPTAVVVVGVDVAKHDFAGAIATADGAVVQRLRFRHPEQTELFIALLEGLRQAGKAVEVVLEPTGTYGDPLRGRLHSLGLAVFVVSPKRVHDAAEVFDGVPSRHDPKAAELLARLHVQGVSRRWQPRSDAGRELRALVGLRELHSEPLVRMQGQLEALLARHWPELGEQVDVMERRSIWAWLGQYPCPGAIVEDAAGAEAALGVASRGQFDGTLFAALHEQARDSLGVPMLPGERAQMQTLVTEMLRQRREVEHIDGLLRAAIGAEHELANLVAWLGAGTTAVLVATVGDPREYSCARAYEKACGLNLKESSSGTVTHPLHITRRGPRRARRYLFLFALRWKQRDAVARAWCERRSNYREKHKMAAVVALMRKAARAVWHLGRGEGYDPAKLFDVRRLEAPAARSRERAGGAAGGDASRASRQGVASSGTPPSSQPHAAGPCRPKATPAPERPPVPAAVEAAQAGRAGADVQTLPLSPQPADRLDASGRFVTGRSPAPAQGARSASVPTTQSCLSATTAPASTACGASAGATRLEPGACASTSPRRGSLDTPRGGQCETPAAQRAPGPWQVLEAIARARPAYERRSAGARTSSTAPTTLAEKPAPAAVPAQGGAD